MRIANQFRRSVGSKKEERGVTIVMVAVAMVAIVAMAAMSIDLVTLYLAREEAQRTADAAALAAARILSVSGVTSTGDPGASNWPAICAGLGGWATQAAQAAAAQNMVGGQPPTVTVTYSDGTGSAADCSTLSPAFAVNPMVTVQVAPTTIPSFFSRIWGSTGKTVSATATAEAFNPSGSDTNGVAPNGNVTPVQPRCVKPWIIPNLDPDNLTCVGGPCTLVSIANGAITHKGVSSDVTGATGVVGEQFNLYANCGVGVNCSPIDLTPGANKVSTNQPNLEYWPGLVSGPASAVPSCASSTTNYQTAVAGCDQSTRYLCGQALPNPGANQVDLAENPGGITGDTAVGLACALTTSRAVPLDGTQDGMLSIGRYPFVAIAGSANPLQIAGPIANSVSIMSLPIYDQTVGLPISTTNTAVTIVGFLQVFVNDVNADGSVKVTVMNVAGCGSNGFTNPPVSGSLPVPVRLITPHAP